MCGTHIKGTPHGKISDVVENIKKITVYAKEIRGIVYYIDDKEINCLFEINSRIEINDLLNLIIISVFSIFEH